MAYYLFLMLYGIIKQPAPTEILENEIKWWTRSKRSLLYICKRINSTSLYLQWVKAIL